MTLLGNTDISSEITELQTLVTTLEGVLGAVRVVTDPGQAAQLGQAVMTLGSLANLATALMVVVPQDTELPPTYNAQGYEIT
jgi:hypothetical protein